MTDWRKILEGTQQEGHYLETPWEAEPDPSEPGAWRVCSPWGILFEVRAFHRDNNEAVARLAAVGVNEYAERMAGEISSADPLPPDLGEFAKWAKVPSNHRRAFPWLAQPGESDGEWRVQSATLYKMCTVTAPTDQDAAKQARLIAGAVNRLAHAEINTETPESPTEGPASDFSPDTRKKLGELLAAHLSMTVKPGDDPSPVRAAMTVALMLLAERLKAGEPV